MQTSYRRLPDWAQKCGLIDNQELRGRSFRIGLIDAFINPDTANIHDADIRYRSFGTAGWPMRKRRNEHGNLMMSLICGQPNSPFEGLLPSSKVYFSNAIRYSTPRHNALAISHAICWMCKQQVSIILMPFGLNQCHLAVSRALDVAAQNAVAVVAAAGNHGANSLFFPANHASVRAITATGYNGDELPGYCSVALANHGILAKRVPTFSDSGYSHIDGTSPACVLWGMLSLLQP